MRAPRLLLRLTGKALALAALLAVFAAGTANAQNLCYVDTGGDNAQSGLTPATAKETIQACVDEPRVSDGGLISIEAGTYNEQVSFPDGKGVNLEVRATGTFTRVIVSDGFVIADNVTVRPNTEGFSDGVFRLEPDGANRTLDLVDGSLTINDPDGVVGDGRVRIASGEVRLDDDTSVSGELTYLSEPILVYRDVDGSDTDVTAGGEFPAAFDGAAASLDVNLGDGNVLNFGSVVFSGGADLNVAVDSELEGTIVVEGDIDITGGGDAGSLDVNAGTVNIIGTLTVEDVDIADNDDIVFDFNSNTLTVTGSFTRLGGSLAGTAGATLAFAGDDADAVFGPGPNFSIQTLTIDKDGQQLEITEDVNVTGSGVLAFEIAAGTEVDFTGEQINVTADGIVDVDGDVTGLSTIVFRAAGAQIRGDGNYGDILVTTAGGGDINVSANEDVVFTGTLTLNSGGITVDGTSDISPAEGATVSVTLASDGQDIDGSFNAAGNGYNLEYTGDMDPADAGGVVRTVGTEFATDNLLDLTFSVFDGTVDADGAPAGTISGDVMLTGVSAAGDAYTVLFPDDVTIEGSLTVGENATLGSGLADADVTLAGANNTVEGSVDAPVNLILEDGVTLTGSDDDELAATVDDVIVATNASVTINNIQSINDLTTNAGSTLNLTLADEMAVTGDVSLSGDNVTLGSAVNADMSVTITDGTLALGANDLAVSGDFTVTAPADVNITASTGEVIFDTNNTVDVDGETIPRVRLAGATSTLGSDLEITTELVETGAGNFVIGADSLTIGGALSSDGGTIVTGTGGVSFNTTTATLSGDPTIAAPVIVAEGQTLTVASSTTDARTITVDEVVTLAGTLVLDDNDLLVDNANALIFDGGDVEADAGIVIIAGGTIENEGSVANLEVTDGAVVVGDASDAVITVTNQLRLGNQIQLGDTATDELILEDGVLIIMDFADAMVDEPTFGGAVSIVYNVGMTMGNEVPENGDLVNLTINDVVVVDQDVSVAGTLAVAADLDAGVDDVITLNGGATLLLQDGFNIADANIVTTAFNLTVDTTGPNNLNDDILDFVDEDEITTLTVSLNGAPGILTVSDPTSVNNIVLDSGELELDANFTITGDLTFGAGTIDNDGARVSLTFSGGAEQSIALNGDYVVDNIDVTIDKTDNSVVNITGSPGDEIDFLTASTAGDVEILYLNGGIVQTGPNAAVLLYQDASTQGFERNVDEATDEESHIAGNVRKRVYQGDPFGTNPVTGTARSARFEFPTGPEATEEAPDYRPYALTFRENVVTTTDITVNHQNRTPGGVRGLPIQSGDVLIGNYPDYYWLVSSSTSLGQAQAVDVELTATDIGLPFTDEDDLRIIRRFDGDATTNEWNVQGSSANYDNFVSVDADGDTTAVVRVVNSTGGIVPQGSRFTLGLPTRPPLFTNVTDTLRVAEGGSATFDFDADPQDLGETVTFSLGEGAPEWVSIDAQTGLLTAAPGAGDGGTYIVDVIASDGTDTTTHQLTIIVGDFLQITPAQADTTISAGQTLAIDFDVTDPNPADPVTWSLAEGVDNAAIDAETGEFTFTPASDQVGATYTFSISAQSSTDSTGLSFDVTVQSADFMLGDVNASGALTLADVSLTLAAVIGDTTLNESAELAADVSGAAGVSAFDAALMLQCLAAHGPSVDDTSVCEFPAEGATKTNAIVAYADIAWGEGENTENGVAIPVTLSGTVKNVYSVEVTADVDMTATTVQNVTGNMPEGWQLAWTADKKTGTIRVAMFGATPINYEGEVARLIFSLNENETSVNLQGDAFVNENPAVQLGSTFVKEIPAEFALSDNYPNPFNPTTTFTYSLPEASHVTIEVYDVAGRLVQTLVNGEKEAGRYEVKWDGRNAAGSSVASGVYLYRINAQSFTQVKTMMLVK